MHVLQMALLYAQGPRSRSQNKSLLFQCEKVVLKESIRKEKWSEEMVWEVYYFMRSAYTYKEALSVTDGAYAAIVHFTHILRSTHSLKEEEWQKLLHTTLGTLRKSTKRDMVQAAIIDALEVMSGPQGEKILQKIKWTELLKPLPKIMPTLKLLPVKKVPQVDEDNSLEDF